MADVAGVIYRAFAVIFCCENSTTTSANKICPQWAVRLVQPIVFNFAERRICTILTTNGACYKGGAFIVQPFAVFISELDYCQLLQQRSEKIEKSKFFVCNFAFYDLFATFV